MSSKPLPGWPRLLPRELAAAYCGISVNHFMAQVPVQPMMLGTKKLWDRQAIDEWLDDPYSSRYSVTSAEGWLDRA